MVQGDQISPLLVPLLHRLTLIFLSRTPGGWHRPAHRQGRRFDKIGRMPMLRARANHHPPTAAMPTKKPASKPVAKPTGFITLPAEVGEEPMVVIHQATLTRN
jgi:hypothetical protein